MTKTEFTRYLRTSKGPIIRRALGVKSVAKARAIRPVQGYYCFCILECAAAGIAPHQELFDQCEKFGVPTTVTADQLAAYMEITSNVKT